MGESTPVDTSMNRRELLRRSAVAAGAAGMLYAAPVTMSRALADPIGTPAPQAPGVLFCGLYSFDPAPTGNFQCINPAYYCSGLPFQGLPSGYSFDIDASDLASFKIVLVKEDPLEPGVRNFYTARAYLPTTGLCAGNTVQCRAPNLSSTTNPADTITFDFTGVPEACLENHLIIEFVLGYSTLP